MKTSLIDIKRKCKNVLNTLLNRGIEVCSDFTARADSTYFCANCAYSQYIHLCKEIVEAEE